MRDLIDELSEARVPADPVERARKRIDDAAKRSGIDGAVKATVRRIKATKNNEKLSGIADVCVELGGQFADLANKAAARIR